MAAYTEEIGAAICDHITDGNSIESAAKHVGISDRTVYRWANGFGAPESFCQEYARAMRIRADRMGEEMLHIADNKGSDIKLDASGAPVFDEAGNPVIDHDNIQRSKLQIETRKYLMGTWHSERYGPKSKVEMTGKDGGPIELKSKSDDELNTRILELATKTGAGGVAGVVGGKAAEGDSEEPA